MDADSNDVFPPSAAVICAGEYRTLCGMSGDDSPSFVERTPCAETVRCAAEQRSSDLPSALLPISTPMMEHGVVSSFDAYAAWIDSLRADASAVLVPEKPWAGPPTTPCWSAGDRKVGLAPRHRALVLEHLLESGAEPPVRVLVAPSPSLILLAMGRTDGVVVDCGYTTCSVTTLQGATDAVASERVHMGGRDAIEAVAATLAHSLTSNGSCAASAPQAALIAAATRVVERPFDTTFEAPDGVSFSVPLAVCGAREGTAVPETTTAIQPGGPTARLLANPQAYVARLRTVVPSLPCDAVGAFSLECGIGRAVARAIQDRGGRGRGDVMVAGNPSMDRNFTEVLRCEVADQLGGGVSASLPSFVLPPERRSSEWIGGSILAELSVTQSCFATRGQADEHGYDHVARTMSLPTFGD